LQELMTIAIIKPVNRSNIYLIFIRYIQAKIKIPGH
jgi:hypothetical protein